MMDLLEYVAEATADHIQEFVQGDLFSGDASALSDNSSKLHKRHIRLLVQSGALAEQTVDELHERAMDVDYDMPVNDGKITIPNGGRELSDFLHFLRDRIYRGHVTGQSFLANSARVRSPD